MNRPKTSGGICRQRSRERLKPLQRSASRLSIIERSQVDALRRKSKEILLERRYVDGD
jgi:hypothetical protein